MATIVRTGGPISSNSQLQLAEALSTNYWGDITNELIFVIPFWQVSRMLSVGSNNEIALRITNITEPSNVYANWIVFNQSMADTLNDPVERGIYYFVLDDSFFNGPVLTSTPPIEELDGIRHINNTPENNVLRARIGKDQSDNYSVFFLAAECSIIDPGTGGGGALSGAKVPRT